MTQKLSLLERTHQPSFAIMAMLKLSKDLKPYERIVIKNIYKDEVGNTKIDFYIRKMSIIERLRAYFKRQ